MKSKAIRFIQFEMATVAATIVALMFAVLPLPARSAPPARPAQSAPTRGPSTAEERSRAVKVAHALEDDPLAANAKQDRSWIVEWIIAIPDITVNVCADYFDNLPDPPRGHSQEIFTQMMISSTAFMIEHPDKAKDDQAVAFAGLSGSLKAYQSVLKRDPAARWAQMDKLVQMRDQSKLEDYVAEMRAKCAREDEKDPPGTIRASR